MDNRTLLAIVLSVVVVTGSVILSNVLWPSQPAPAAAVPSPAPAPTQPPTATPGSPTAAPMLPSQQDIAPKTVHLENNVIDITLSNLGVVATSIRLKKFKELDGSTIEMVHASSGQGGAFQTSFGDFSAPALDLPFEVAQTGPSSFEFRRTFVDTKGTPFLFSRTLSLTDDDYVVKVETRIKGDNGALPVLASGTSAYTVSFGPQLGPRFKDLTNPTAEYRKYYHFNAGNRVEQMGSGMFLFWAQGMNHETMTTADRHTWSAVVGKYFGVIGIPDGTNYVTTLSNKPRATERDVSRLAFTRPSLTSSDTADTLYFYVGPKEENALKKYDEAASNAFGLQGLKLQRSMEEPFLWGWFGLETLLKLGLQGFTLLVHNWGVSIILLTLLIKLLTWPLTAKSYRANAAMQTLQPKMKELQEKYKDDPKKLNEQMMGLYQKEGVNPLGGCLPMVLQIPVFFSLYALFNTQFDLRGAMFIPGWIPDLSLPDTVWHWGFPLWLVNWTDLRILPFVMVATQIWTSMLSQPASGSTAQMRIMTYGLPIIFLFMLYEMPSGLMVYWCAQNVLTVVQQVYINKRFKKTPPAPAGKPNLKLAPRKSGGKISK